jgi:Zn-dependent protease with chaperone function
MTIAIAAIVMAGIVLPHLLYLQRVAPVTASVLWLASLGLRALTGLVAVTYLLFFLPRTEVFESLTHWCLHTLLPGFADELAVDGHRIGDLMLFGPGLALTLSLVVVCLRTARNARAARLLVERHDLGRGPQGTVIVGGPEIVFAVAGLAHPRIVVSAGALTSLDDAELAAALDHERGHIARYHRFVMLAATALSALAWMIPGRRRAVREVAFHLERDADRWALERRNDRLALASVICKAAASVDPSTSPAIAGLGQTGVRERLGQLLEDQPRRPSHPLTAALNVLAAVMAGFTLLLAAALPAAAASAGAGADAHGAHHEHCEH